METIKLTQYSHGAGCGCKISPKMLEGIIGTGNHRIDPNLLVGNSTKDDAAVYDLGNGKAIISTTDFFMPIVDDPFDFGAIASVNAISDIYAMGGRPLMAIAILGWPIDKIPTEFAHEVLEGSRKVCQEAGISLAGGHSIDCPEPIFGLAVTGQVDKKNIKQNSSAKEGSYLFLTKKLGVGIISTAQKKGLAKAEHLEEARHSMLKLNDFGVKLGELDYVNSLTDVTGFGLLGHLIEICEGSDLSAEIDFNAIPKFNFIDEYIAQKCVPGGTNRNWDSYGDKVSEISDYQRTILADPQTSGGLLISVDHNSLEIFNKECKHWGINLKPIGRLTTKSCIGIQIV
ncbi:MAG: selenide, water dikinase SelD [Bacteroidetes bacterium]|nr:selenide, water dikinase SelD [Bacteroidota bacterium]MDA1119822.1 selenide, water dikinase SelD [Bacteroidota bacterium]